MKRSEVFLRILILVTIAFSSSGFSSDAGAAQKCDEWVAKVVSVQGKVEARRVGEREWVDARLNDTYCAEDMIRVSDQSRAGVLLRNDVILRLDQNTTISFSGPDKEETFLLKLISGAAHFFSRSPRRIKVITPFVNGTVGGTEFFVKVEQEQASILVFEGQVSATNDSGSVSLTKGQSAVAEAGRAPELRVVVRPRDAVQWALYYPPILDYRPTDFSGGPENGWQARIRQSIEFYLEGDLTNAFAALQGMPENIPDPRFFTYRAGLRLTVGRLDEAALDVEKALLLDPQNGHAFALESIIAVVQNRKEKALELAKKAVALAPESSPPRIALSYAQQANFDLKGSLSSLQEAVTMSPDNALALARLAELRLSLGDLNEALDAAREAVTLNPKLARTQTVLGFAYLTQVKTADSRKAFERAIELDQADPLPRLGLGLAKIRDGELKEGRKEIEIAIILDPNNSLIRSYLGKAYFEEKRNKRAREQFEMAKELDPLDPTPFFYDAIRKQTVNRPVEALEELEKSIELNDNRAVYRSRLQLDQDLAARSVSLARIYEDLGFQQRALVEGWKSLDMDPTNYSAHRLLADSYAALPRHDMARVSELLKAQLLQPININPVQPQLAESRLFIPSGLGPSDSSLNEFNALFNRNRFAVLASGIAGEHGTLGEEVVHSGLFGKFSYSIGQFHFQTDGFRANNDLERNIYNLFAQVSLTPRTSVQAEYRNTDFESGDLSFLFDSDNFDRRERDEIGTESIRFGLHHAFSPKSDFIASFVYRTRDTSQSFPGTASGFEGKIDSTGFSIEAQHLYHSELLNIVSGVGHVWSEEKDKFTFFGQSFIDKFRSPHTNLYLYSQINYPKSVTWTVGGSADFAKYGFLDDFKRQQFNPKFGVTWNPLPGTTLRAAAFRTLMRSGVTDQTFSGETLEPTQVAGFNQFFDESEGTRSWRYGVGIDQKFSSHWYAGAEFSKRDLTIPAELATVEEHDLEEYLTRAYFYWTPHSWLALGPEYQFERFRRPRDFAEDQLIRLDTHRVSLGINFFHPCGFIARLKPTFVAQDGEFLQGFSGPPAFTPLFRPDDSHFFVLDAAIGYRLPKRWGLITLEARNLFDKSFRFQDTDPGNPSMVPARSILGRFTLSF